MVKKIVTGAAKAPRAAKKTAASKSSAQKTSEKPAQEAAAQAAPSVPPPTPVNGDLIEFTEADALNCVLKSLLCLTEWIERARHLAESVNTSSEIDKDFAAALRHHEIAFADADWGHLETCGLRELQIIIFKKASKLGDGAVALARAHEGKESHHA